MDNINYVAIVPVGTPVVVRSYTSGVMVGRLDAGAAGVVSLTDWRQLRTWIGVPGSGSVYELIASSVRPADRGPLMKNIGLFQQADLVVIDEATYTRLAGE